MASLTFDGQLKTQIAKNFVSDFKAFGKDKFYVAIGQVKDVTAEGLEHRSKDRDNITRRNIAFAKRVKPDDATLMIERNDWFAGITLEALNTKKNMATGGNRFYVNTAENNVYMCLDNNSYGSSGSQFQPTGTDTNTIVTPDGYAWKYLYTISGSQLKFIDDQYIPIEELPFYENVYFAYEDLRQRQYAVQYEANLERTGGAVSGVAITSEPYPDLAIYERGVPENDANTVVTASGNTVRISDPNLPSPSAANFSLYTDYYVGYFIRILTGDAAGVVKQIIGTNVGTAGDNPGEGGAEQDVLTLESSWDANRKPKEGDRFEIGVGITITGNGVNALAFGRLESVPNFSGGKLKEVVVYAVGSGYSVANASVRTSYVSTSFGNPTINLPKGTPGTTDANGLPWNFPIINPSFNVLLSSAIGRDPTLELFAKHARVQVSVASDNRDSLIGNDYRDVMLWVNPEIGAGETFAGEIAGYNDRSLTKVDVRGTTLEIATLLGRGTGNMFVYGETTKEFAEVESASVKSRVSASLLLNDLSVPYINNEQLRIIERSGNAFSGTTLGVVVDNTFYGDTSLTITKEEWRCATKLGISLGNDFTNFTPSLDGVCNGASGSSGTITSFQDDPEDLTDLRKFVLVTDISNNAGNTLAFTKNESLSYTNTDGVVVGVTIDQVLGPELDLFSGDMLYIEGLTQEISRFFEQTDIFRFTFEF